MRNGVAGHHFADTPAELSPGHLAEWLTAYVSNPLYRSARFEELVIDDNPYRRPVRPEDLSFLRFDEPFTRANSSQLSSLIGHRILLNIYDTSRPMLPRTMTADRWRDFGLFYGERNRVLGELVRPFLEEHVFSFVRRAVDEMDEPGASSSVTALRQVLREIAAVRAHQAEETVSVVKRSLSPAETARMVAVQVLASSLNAPLQVSPALVLRSLDGAASRLQPVRRGGGRIEGILENIVNACGFGSQPHQYYQFYLPSTLALMNYVNAMARNPAGMFRFLGAMCARTLDSIALIGGYGSQLAELATPGDRSGADVADVAGAGRPAPTLESVIRAVTSMAVVPLAERFGPEPLREFGRGVREYALLLDVHHDELMAHLTWIDRADECKAKAERLQHAIEEHRVPVELDTFVESCEECSTTHVHDDDRLLIIERGEMEFWNCFSGTHKFRPGDMMFIPKHRLHGSVVLSGECVYHQPVITPELDARFG